MTTLVQMKRCTELEKDGWTGVTGPITSDTPIGGPIILLNNVNDICWLMPDGIEVIMSANEQSEFIQSKI